MTLKDDDTYSCKSKTIHFSFANKVKEANSKCILGRSSNDA